MKYVAAQFLVLLFAAVTPTHAAEREHLALPGPLRALGPVEIENARTSGNRFDAKTWRRVKTYDMQALKALEPLPMRQIVGVRFNYRYKRIEHWRPKWYYSSIWNYRRAAQDEFDYIPVYVSEADLQAFTALPSEFRAGRELLVYGQVLKDADADFIFLRLIGTKVKRGARGSVTVSW